MPLARYLRGKRGSGHRGGGVSARSKRGGGGEGGRRALHLAPAALAVLPQVGVVAHGERGVDLQHERLGVAVPVVQAASTKGKEQKQSKSCKSRHSKSKSKKKAEAAKAKRNSILA